MQAFLVFLDVEGPILIEVAAEVYGPQLDDGLGHRFGPAHARSFHAVLDEVFAGALHRTTGDGQATCQIDRKSTRLNSSHGYISYAVFCLKKKKKLRVFTLGVDPILQQHTRLLSRSTCQSS